MKNLLLGLFALTLLSSCSTDEAINENIVDANAKILETFEIIRNADGSYALTHEVSDGINVDYSNDKSQNEVYFYADTASKNTISSQNFSVENERLNIVFKDENNSNLPTLNIIDDESNNDLDLLNTYSILQNKDGSLQVNFEVEKGVDVAFGYNTSENTNDIYLTEGNSTQLKYSKNYNKEVNGSIRVDFVQTTTKSTERRKPRLIYSN